MTASVVQRGIVHRDHVRDLAYAIAYAIDPARAAAIAHRNDVVVANVVASAIAADGPGAALHRGWGGPDHDGAVHAQRQPEADQLYGASSPPARREAAPAGPRAVAPAADGGGAVRHLCPPPAGEPGEQPRLPEMRLLDHPERGERRPPLVAGVYALETSDAADADVYADDLAIANDPVANAIVDDRAGADANANAHDPTAELTSTWHVRHACRHD